jgi:hypothetical protein
MQKRGLSAAARVAGVPPRCAAAHKLETPVLCLRCCYRNQHQSKVTEVLLLLLLLLLLPKPPAGLRS